MKLSLELIKDWLETTDNIEFFESSSSSLTLGRPVFLTEHAVLESDTLYITDVKKLSSAERIEKGASCICIGMPNKSLIRNLGGLLVLSDPADIFLLSNKISVIFDRFDRWEEELLSASYLDQTRQAYQKMLDASSSIFENGLSLMNNAFHIIFQDEINIRSGGYTAPSESVEDFAIPAEMISYFKYDKDYQRISEARDIFYYDGTMLPHRVLCKNIFQDERFLFRIIITECSRPFRTTDEILLEYLSMHFIHCLHRFSLSGSMINDGFSQLLAEAIDTGRLNRMAIESELKTKSWSARDTYLLASVHVSADDMVISTLNYYSNEAAKLSPSVFTFPFHESIIILLNETAAGTSDAFSEKLSVFVRENNFRVGISNYSGDFYTIQTMYRQAEMALMIGLSEKPMEWIHWFSKYTLQYIYNMLTSGTELGQLYSPIYYHLERYDKENGTSYLETLRVYLKCRMNTVQAAKELFIQRSTMIYRLKRIREITDNDLEDSDDLLHLYLTFSIIEREEKQKER